MSRPIAVDLFAGAGGMSLGLEAAGFDIAAAVEIDPVHCSTHHFNFPYCQTICSDIKDFDVRELGFDNEIDLVVGGSPCQAFSQIGKQDKNDPRRNLIFDFADKVIELGPKYFLFENVPAIASPKNLPLLRKLMEFFQIKGYNTSWSIENSAYYGAPQTRKRLFIRGSRNGLNLFKMPEQTHGQELLPLATVKDAIADLDNIPCFINPCEDLGVNADSDYLDIPSGIFALCHRRKHQGRTQNLVFGHIGSQHTDQTTRRFASIEPGKRDPISRFYKLHPDKQCCTLRAGTPSNRSRHTAPRPIHYARDRCITIREAARLHTYPDWFRFNKTIWHGHRQIGNSVIPFMAKALGDEVIKCLGIDTSELEVRTIEQPSDSLLNCGVKECAEYWREDNRRGEI